MVVVSAARAASRSESAIRDALAGGRSCLRSPEACSFEVRVPGGAWQSVGSALDAAAVLEARAHGGDVEVLVNGAQAATGEASEVLRLTLPATGCQVLRARVGEGFSAPIYVGCRFAQGH